LKSVLLADENCLRVGRRDPLWTTETGWFRRGRVCVAQRGTLLLTDRAFFYVCGEIPVTGGYVFGDNLTCLSFKTPLHAESALGQEAGTSGIRLALTWKCPEQLVCDILFPAEQTSIVDQWKHELNALGSARA
jgi:hypothetical protein